MFLLRSILPIRLLAVLAFFGACWQTTAGNLEHLGLISHVHEVADGSKGAKAPAQSHGLMHHHHLPDLEIQTGLFVSLTILVETTAPETKSFVPPDAPVFGIEHPPQLS